MRCMGRRELVRCAAVLTALTACEPERTPVDRADGLLNFCQDKCSFQASCVPELEPLVPECVRQCRAAFDDPERFTETCDEPSLRDANDPAGPYVTSSVVRHTYCVISLGCTPEEGETCDEARLFCLDGLSLDERCSRGSRIGVRRCQEARWECQSAQGTDCWVVWNQCMQDVQNEYEDCRSS